MNGHLEVAKWLVESYLQINVSADNNYGFRYACANGHLEVAKWLVQSYPSAINISAWDDFASRSSQMVSRVIPANKYIC